MNPRAFCRESGYDLAIVLTYSFDPVFFENVVLHDLRAGGSGTVVVVGDPHEVSAAIEEKGWALDFLGRRYMLSAATHEQGAFHPKLIIRLGDKDGIVLISSGNLTSGGWGGNREMGTSWKFGPGHDDVGVWLRPLLASIYGWCSGEHEKEIIARSMAFNWIDTLPTASPDLQPPILHSLPTVPLATQLESRWQGRKFSKLSILTGSSDEQGAFIKWAHNTFGVKKVVVAGTVGSLSFDPKKLSNLPVEVRIIPVEGEMLHAKFYWFEGPQGSSAILGSANCSAAAWLLAPEKGGNVETVLCFDEATKDDFSESLELFTGKTLAPDKALIGAVTSEDDEEQIQHAAYRLTALNWNAQYAIASFSLSPPPPTGAKVTLVLDGITGQARRTEDDGQIRFQTHYDAEFNAGTLFGYATIKTAKEEVQSSVRWVDCLVDLDNARSAVRTVEPLLGLEESRAPNEQKKLVGAIQLVIEALFSDSGNFPDPAAFAKNATDKNAESDRPAEPIDPVKVLCDLSEIEAQKTKHLGQGPHGHKSLSLSGILNLLFSNGDRSNRSEPVEPDDECKTHKEPQQKDNPQEPVDERYAQRLAQQVAIFLERLAGPEFGETCSATQFVQAIAFPLAVAELGRQQGWVSRQLAEKWALRLFAILFRLKGGKSGLLQQVMGRYEEQGKGDVFAGAVGDGALWSALVATIANSKWEGPAAAFEKALAVRELFREPILLKSANASQLQRYSSALRAKEATDVLRKHAPSIVLALEALEKEVKTSWLKVEQGGMVKPEPVKAGDLLWRPNVGWAFGIGSGSHPDSVSVRLRGNDTEVMQGFYLNVSQMAARNPQIDDLIYQVYAATSSIHAGASKTSTISDDQKLADLKRGWSSDYDTSSATAGAL